MSGRWRAVSGASIVALATVLTLLGVPVASAQGQALYVSEAADLPLAEPWSPAWEGAPAVDVALSPQSGVVPASVETSIDHLRVRAMTDGLQFAVLIEWQDRTADESVLRVDTFADAVAIQFAQGSGISFCMGQQAGSLNIWHWKADWAADLRAARDVDDEHPNMPTDTTLPPDSPPAAGAAPRPEGYVTGRDAGNLRSLADRPSSVEDLNAVGFGTLTPQPVSGQNVVGASEYRDGTWRVVMSRQLTSEDGNDASLRLGRSSVIAFAVWDGSRGDRDGQKATSVWLALAFPPAEAGLLDAWPFLVLMVGVFGLFAAIFVLGGGAAAAGVGWPGGRPPGTTRAPDVE